MLSGALKTLDQRNAYIDESQLVTLQQYLLDRLNNTTNSFGFINYAVSFRFYKFGVCITLDSYYFDFRYSHHYANFICSFKIPLAL